MKKTLCIVLSLVFIAILFTGCSQPFIQPPESFEVKDISARYHTLVVMQSGMVWGFGNNEAGQLGNGATTTNPVTQATLMMKDADTAMTDVTTVATGLQHSLILLSTGEVWAVGNNANGQLGDGTTTNRLYPVRVKTSANTYLQDVVAIAAGGAHSVFLCDDGTVWTTGDNGYGQLGLSQNGGGAVYATQVSYTGNEAIGISARTQFTLLALAENENEADTGEAVGFGDNNQGQLGQGVESGAENSPVPIYVTGTTHLLNVNSVSAGGSHALVQLTSGQVVAIGDNGNGQLGIGNYDDKKYPTTVKNSGNTDSLFAVEQIAAGASHSLFLVSGNSLLAAGANSYGQLGDGSTTQSNLPKVITPPEGKTIQKIFAGDFHSLLLMTDGTLWAMGSNEYGQLGVPLGVEDYEATPVEVVFQND